MFSITTLLHASVSNVQFIQNNGQWESNVLHKAYIPNGAVFLEKDAFVFVYEDKDKVDEYHHSKSHGHSHGPAPKRHLHAFKIKFVGSATENLQALDEEVTYQNYFLGNDRSKWQSKVPLHKTILYKNLYAGIDMKVYSSGYDFKYDLIVGVGADPKDIKLAYEGFEELNKYNDELRICLSIIELTEEKPYTYQGDIEIDCAYKLNENTVTFDVGEYNKQIPLIIDPTLVGGTYSGMSGGADQYGFAAAAGLNEDIIGGGECFGLGYPISMGAFQTTFAGAEDMGISRFTPDGTTQLFATYLGGFGSDNPYSLLADNQDNVLIMGITNGTGYPTTTGCFDSTYNGSGDLDIVVSKLSADGTMLLGSTYVGGANNDGNFDLTFGYNANRGDIEVDAANNIYVSSTTNSANFPFTPGAHNTTLSGVSDGVIFKLSPNLSTMVWGTFIGGSGNDGVTSIVLDSNEDIFFSGASSSANFPVSSPTIQSTNAGANDGIAGKLSNNGSNLIYATYIGGPGIDFSYFIDVNDMDEVFVLTETSDRSTFPISAGKYNNAGGTVFLAQLKQDFTVYEQSTIVGGNDSTTFSQWNPTAFLVDVCGNTYVGGYGNGSSYETTNDAFKTTHDGSEDFYFMVLEPGWNNILFGSYFGGSSSEHCDGGTSRFDKRGAIYHGVCTNSSDFPVSGGAAYPTIGSGWNLAVFKIDFGYSKITANISTNLGDTIYITDCPPVELTFNPNTNAADVYMWDFGDGDTSLRQKPTHTFNDPGIYKVVLIVSADSLSDCVGADTAEMIVNIFEKPEAEFTWENNGPDIFFDYQFINQSTNATQYKWTFGDGNTSNVSDPFHTYASTGTYEICLIARKLFDDCSDTICKSILIEINPYLYIPNAFTPNGDGINEEFTIDWYGLSDVNFQIYNRWGEMVFETTDLNVSWRGEYNGDIQPVGSYVYQLSAINFLGEEIYETGDLTILK